jgi:hypothetical protein
MNRKKIRQFYKDNKGSIPKGYEIHHIIPIYEGGTDDILNLIALSFEDHKRIHHERYLKNGDVRDLMASKIGITSSQLRIEKCKLGGKAGGKSQYENKIGIHSQTPEERLKLASLGGKRGAFTQSKWQSEFGKRGGVKNKGFVWLTNDIDNIKYTKQQQQIKSIEHFIEENKNYRIGRTELKTTCSICGKTMNARAIGRYHNERCKHDKNKIN